MSIPVAFDVRLASDLAMQIDGCEFRTVKQYFRSPTSEIRMVVLVEPPFALEEVAAVFAAASMNNGAHAADVAHRGGAEVWRG